jgi:redox-sensing transcriptional repressor
VQPVDELENVIRQHGVQIGVVATPAPVAQEVCDRMVAAGVTGVLNFAPCVLSVPSGVMVRRVDLSTELQILAFHEQRRVATHLAETTDPVVTPPLGTPITKALP